MGEDPLDGGGSSIVAIGCIRPAPRPWCPGPPFLHDIMGLLPIAVPGDSWGGCVPQ